MKIATTNAFLDETFFSVVNQCACLMLFFKHKWNGNCFFHRECMILDFHF